MAFGIKRVALPAAQYGLDEDGFVDVLSRPSARLVFALRNAGEDENAMMLRVFAAFIRGWKIKADGIELIYSQDAVLDLPVEILEAVDAEFKRLPLRSPSMSGLPPNGSVAAKH